MFGSLAGSIALYRSGFLGAVRGCRSECVGSGEGHDRCFVTGAWGAFRFLRIGASSLGCAEFWDPFACVGAHAGDLGSCFGHHVEVVGWQLRSVSAFRSTAGPPRASNVSPRDPFLLVEFRPSKVPRARCCLVHLGAALDQRTGETRSRGTGAAGPRHRVAARPAGRSAPPVPTRRGCGARAPRN